MNKTLRGLLVLGLMTAFLGCASEQKDPREKKEKELFDQGTEALNKKNYKIAAERYEKLLKDYPTTSALVGSLYNLGLIYEAQKKFVDAAVQYRHVIDLFQNLPSRDQADALYRLSICYEVLNQDDKMIFTLLQLEKIPQYLGRESAIVEIYARLAAAYARLGQVERSEYYYAKADVGMKKMRRVQTLGDMYIWLPKTLYSMGHMSPPNLGDPDKDFAMYLTLLERSQSWLLRAAEIGDGFYARQASKEIIDLYKGAWEKILKAKVVKSRDKLREAQSRQNKQRLLAAKLDRVLEKLYLERHPETPEQPESPLISDVFKNVSNVQKSVDAVINANDVRDQLTAEAKALKAVRREGQIIDSTDSVAVIQGPEQPGQPPTIDSILVPQNLRVKEGAEVQTSMAGALSQNPRPLPPTLAEKPEPEATPLGSPAESTWAWPSPKPSATPHPNAAAEIPSPAPASAVPIASATPASAAPASTPPATDVKLPPLPGSEEK